eukprot:SAG11_NODE_391_length_9839_cov_4.875257_10_plen_1087_part_00
MQSWAKDLGAERRVARARKLKDEAPAFRTIGNFPEILEPPVDLEELLRQLQVLRPKARTADHSTEIMTGRQQMVGRGQLIRLMEHQQRPSGASGERAAALRRVTAPAFPKRRLLEQHWEPPVGWFPAAAPEEEVATEKLSIGREDFVRWLSARFDGDKLVQAPAVVARQAAAERAAELEEEAQQAAKEAESLAAEEVQLTAQLAAEAESEKAEIYAQEQRQQLIKLQQLYTTAATTFSAAQAEAEKAAAATALPPKPPWRQASRFGNGFAFKGFSDVQSGSDVEQLERRAEREHALGDEMQYPLEALYRKLDENTQVMLAVKASRAAAQSRDAKAASKASAAVEERADAHAEVMAALQEKLARLTSRIEEHKAAGQYGATLERLQRQTRELRRERQQLRAAQKKASDRLVKEAKDEALVIKMRDEAHAEQLEMLGTRKQALQEKIAAKKSQLSHDSATRKKRIVKLLGQAKESRDARAKLRTDPGEAERSEAKRRELRAARAESHVKPPAWKVTSIHGQPFRRDVKKARAQANQRLEARRAEGRRFLVAQEASKEAYGTAVAQAVALLLEADASRVVTRKELVEALVQMAPSELSSGELELLLAAPFAADERRKLLDLLLERAVVPRVEGEGGMGQEAWREALMEGEWARYEDGLSEWSVYKALKPLVLREGCDKSSPKVDDVKAGEEITALETKMSRGVLRVRCARGWLSETLDDGTALLELLPAGRQGVFSPQVYTVLKPAVLRKECGKSSPKDAEDVKAGEEIAALETKMSHGVLHIRCARGWLSETADDGKALLELLPAGRLGRIEALVTVVRSTMVLPISAGALAKFTPSQKDNIAASIKAGLAVKMPSIPVNRIRVTFRVAEAVALLLNADASRAVTRVELRDAMERTAPSELSSGELELLLTPFVEGDCQLDKLVSVEFEIEVPTSEAAASVSLVNTLVADTEPIVISVEGMDDISVTPSESVSPGNVGAAGRVARLRWADDGSSGAVAIAKLKPIRAADTVALREGFERLGGVHDDGSGSARGTVGALRVRVRAMGFSAEHVAGATERAELDLRLFHDALYGAKAVTHAAAKNSKLTL